MVMLDTSVCVTSMRAGGEPIRARLRSSAPGSLAVSAMVAAELLVGVTLSAHPERTEQVVTAFLTALEVLPFTTEAARAYARLKHQLQRQGQLIGHMDLLIAAHALALDCPLVTGNHHEFGRVPGLRVEIW